MRSITPTMVRKIAVPRQIARMIERWSNASATPNTMVASTASVSVMKRGVRGRNSGDITSSLGSNLGKPPIRLRKSSPTHQLHGLHQRPCRVAHLGLERRILVEIVVAGGIGLVVADIAVELG